MKSILHYSVLLLVLVSSHPSQGSLVGWILGRDNSPFDLSNSEKHFDHLMTQSGGKVEPKIAKDQTKQSNDEETAIAPIPFELSVADEKFIADAQKYTDLILSELDVCQHKLILQLKEDCNDLNEENLSKLGVNLLNCQSQLEGRKIFPCTNSMTLKECTQDMDPNTWNSYHILSNRARSVCYAARQQQFRALTQMTVNKLMTSSSEQLGFIRELKVEQEELGSLAAGTLNSLTQGQGKLLEQQEYLKATQQMASQQISSTLRELSKERAAAFANQKQLSAISDTLKDTLNQAAELAIEQENERKEAQMHLLESLNSIETHVGVFWTQLEESVAKLMSQQEHASYMQSETVQTLERLNQTFQFLLSVSENSRDQLNWIQGLVQKTESKVGKLSTWILHVCYFLLGMLLLSFVQAPAYSRFIFLFLVPINLAMDLQHGIAMELPALVSVLLLFSMVYRLFLFIKNRCSPVLPDKRCEIMFRSSTPEKPIVYGGIHTSVSDKTMENLLNGCTLIEDDDDEDERSANNRTPLPTPSWDSLLRQTQLHHPTVRSIVKDDISVNGSIAQLQRRSPRIASSMSLRDDGTSSLNNTLNLSRSSNIASPRRPTTPRRNCFGKCVDGSSCRNAASKDSDFCYKHNNQ